VTSIYLPIQTMPPHPLVKLRGTYSKQQPPLVIALEIEEELFGVLQLAGNH